MKNAFEYEAELAALREELTETQQISQQEELRANGYATELVATEQRLADAERRNASHESMLRHFASCADVRQVGTMAMEYVVALKPTESGASK